MLTGGCLCGGVRYEITGKIGPVGHCHCITCRKAQGGAFVTNAVRQRQALRGAGPDQIGAEQLTPGAVPLI
jgi:hypothetical protein